MIGKEAYRVDREHAMEHVAGYTIVNDVTTRDLVFREDMKEIGTDWYRGKNAPGFLPTGPFLVPAPFVATPGDLHLELTLNGETMQDATTSDLLFDLPALIAGASQNMPLLPGDLLLTGSPAGNGIVHGRMLRDGDVMVGAIEGLGAQTVRAVAEEARDEHARRGMEPAARPPSDPSRARPHRPRPARRRGGRGVPQLGPLGRRRPCSARSTSSTTPSGPARRPSCAAARASRSRSRST